MTEDRVVYGTENNSTLLECVPRSPQATVTWLIQHNDRKEEVRWQILSRMTGGWDGLGRWDGWNETARVTTYKPENRV